MDEFPDVSGLPPSADGPSLRAVETFDEYYQRDYRKLLGLAFVFTGSRSAAEDLCQEALTEAHRKWVKISGYERPEAWVRPRDAEQKCVAHKKASIRSQSIAATRQPSTGGC